MWVKQIGTYVQPLVFILRVLIYPPLVTLLSQSLSMSGWKSKPLTALVECWVVIIRQHTWCFITRYIFTSLLPQEENKTTPLSRLWVISILSLSKRELFFRIIFKISGDISAPTPLHGNVFFDHLLFWTLFIYFTFTNVAIHTLAWACSNFFTTIHSFT